MADVGRNTPTSDQSPKELSISLAASSVINAADAINAEAYQANVKRIQEVKEMVRVLEVNNEVAHKKFLVGQLEKRAKEGREAEDMLARLRSQPGLSATVQFANNAPKDQSEVILPTTATLVEVSDSHPSPSYSSPAPTTTSRPLQNTQQGTPTNHQKSRPPQVLGAGVFPYYVPPHMVGQLPQYNAVSHPQVPVRQMNFSTTQHIPPQSSVHGPPAHQTAGFQPVQAQHSSQSWSSYPPEAVAPPTVDTVHAPVYYASPAGRVTATPAHSGPSTGHSNPAYPEPGFPKPPTTSRNVVIPTHSLSRNPLSHASTSQAHMRPQDVSVVTGTPSSQFPSTLLHPKPMESRSQPDPIAVSPPVSISQLQRPQMPQHQHQRPPRPSLQPQRLSQQPQHLSQPLWLQQHPQQLQQPPRSMPHPQQRPQVQPPSQQPAQPPQTHSYPPLQSTDRTRSHPSQPSLPQEQGQLRGPQTPLDLAKFIELFQQAAQSETLKFKAFWLHAKTLGIGNEWFNIAINSLPRDVWQSAMARASQSEPTAEAPPPTTAPQQEGTRVSYSTAPATIPLVHAASAAQQATKRNASTGGMTTYPLPRQSSAPYAAEVQYYAEQATRSASSAQATSTSPTPLENTTPTQTVLTTPKCDMPQVQAHARTPKDANKLTLARDILRSLGKIMATPDRETGDEPADMTDNGEGGRLPEVTRPQLVIPPAPLQPLAVRSETTFVDTVSPTISLAKGGVQDEPQHVSPPGPSTEKSALKREHGQVVVIDGPIMIDLTLEEPDGSVDGKGQEPTFPIQTSASAATSGQPASFTNTTNHTPLLEGLSLEESSVDIAADGHSADVHMHGPSSSFTAEEDMEPEFLYPPPATAEPVSPSFEPPPREASEHPPGGKLPLFLPSPPISPAHSRPPETDLEMIVHGGENRPPRKRPSVDVDEVDINKVLVTPQRVGKRRKQQVYVLVPPTPLYVKKAKERATSSDLNGTGEDEELQYSHLEQLLVEESKSRLLERRCRWLNCGAILNCSANLLAHLRNHADEEDLQTPFLCRWASCQRKFGVGQERDAHLEKHTIRPLPCPFAGCDEQFDRPIEVMQHEVQHQKEDHRESLVRKPTCQPIVPAIPARLGPPPHQLPSHRVIPRRVVKCRISADRHAIVGPWILWNIFSPVDLNMRKQNASMRGRPTRQAIDYNVNSSDPRRDDYDFLLALSSYPAKNPGLGDLDSTPITMSAARGLTLWGSGPTISSARGREEDTKAVSVRQDVEARGDNKAEEWQSGGVVAMGEEDAVERMLIV